MKRERERPRLTIKKKGEGRPRRYLLLSIAIHVALIAALATITFRYPIGHLIGLTRQRQQTPERVQFIVLPKGTATGNGGQSTATPPRKGAPAPLRAPTAVPAQVPPTPPVEETQGAISGKEGGRGGARAGVATGVELAEPDPRLPLYPTPFEAIPKTPAQRVDSVVKAAFGVYYDSARYAAEHPERAPGDWTTTTKDGQKWGWDPVGIRLGKFTIPNALLAVLPLDMIANGRSPVEQRTAAWMRNDIVEHAQRSVSEDEFRNAVRRIRERKEKERREKERAIAADGKGSSDDRR